MAEETVIRPDACIDLPDGVDDVTAAAIANPGMSSWAALTERAHLKGDETVLVNGATGASGRLAVQIARHLGAKRVIATGRNAASVAPLAALGADTLIPLDQPPQALRDAFKAELSRGLDVVLDYLWGASAEQLLAALSGHGAPQGEPRVRFVQIGSLSGANISLPSSLLRSSGVELLGSGLGSVPVARLLEAIRGVMAAVAPAGLSVAAEAIPLPDVSEGWRKETSRRVVFTT